MQEPLQTESLSPSAQPLDVRTARRQLASVALAISFISLFAAVVQLLLMLLISTVAPSLANADWYSVVIQTLPMYLISMPLSLLIYGVADAKAPAKAHLGFLTWLGLLSLCFALTYLGNMIGTTVNAMIESLTGEPPQNELQELTLNTPLWANLLFMGILAPIMEEIFFRKLVIDRLTVFGEIPAVLISGLLFGLIHGNFGQFFYASLMGFVFGAIYLRTGRLRYSIALHMAINLLGGVYVSEILKRIDLDALMAEPVAYLMQNPAPLLMLLLYFGFLVLCFLASPIAAALLYKFLLPRKSDSPLSFADWRRALLLNPVVWLFLCVVALMFVA